MSSAWYWYYPYSSYFYYWYPAYYWYNWYGYSYNPGYYWYGSSRYGQNGNAENNSNIDPRNNKLSKNDNGSPSYDEATKAAEKIAKENGISVKSVCAEIGEMILLQKLFESMELSQNVMNKIKEGNRKMHNNMKNMKNMSNANNGVTYTINNFDQIPSNFSNGRIEHVSSTIMDEKFKNTNFTVKNGQLVSNFNTDARGSCEFGNGVIECRLEDVNGL